MMDFHTLLYHDGLIPLLCPGWQRDMFITDRAFRYTDIVPVVVIERPNTFYLFNRSAENWV